MKSERFRAWSPIANIPRRLTISGLRDENEGLEISLEDSMDSERSLRLRFIDVVAYRCIDESYRLKTWAALETNGLPSLLKVDGSQWVTWLEKESGGVLEDFELVHYAIFTDDDCIDIVARSPPEATWHSL